MNTIITTAGGTVMNMAAVIQDKSDAEGHRMLMRHVNTLQAKVDKLNEVSIVGEVYRYQGKKVEVVKIRHNGCFLVAAIMDLGSFELQWCAVEDLHESN